MKPLAPLCLLAAFALLASACNNSDLTGSPEPEESPGPTATPEPEPSATPPLPAEADVAIVLEWDDLGDDWELHLVKPGGQINNAATDCTWNTCIFTSPDWGVVGDTFDDPHKDIDDLDQFGPERIWQAEPEAGVFTVLVEHWGTGLADSDGLVTISVGGAEHAVAMNNLAPQHVWTAATIEFPSGTVTTFQDVFDCSANWSAGCLEPLP